LIANPETAYKYGIDKYWLLLQSIDLWFIITPLTVIQYDNYSDIEGKITNYGDLMIDIDKPWVIEYGKTMKQKIYNDMIRRISDEQYAFSHTSKYDAIEDTICLG
jgi:hypothetical protein